MQISEDMFPSDPNGDLGNLRNSLVKALNRADSNQDAAKLLASTLGYAGSLLRKIYKEDGIKSKSAIKRELDAKKKEDERKAGEATTARLVKEAAAKLAKEKKESAKLAKKAKVQTPKPKTKK